MNRWNHRSGRAGKLVALEHARDIILPDQRVAVCGDWHRNIGWARAVSRALPALAPDVRTMLHLGDWQMPAAETDEAFSKTSIERIYVTLGNHEPWDKIAKLQDKYPGEAIRVSEIIWLLPRPMRMTIGGRRVLSLGGAASIDRQSRIEGLTWFPDEAITDLHVAEAIAGGPADLMLTHEGPAGTPVRPVREILRTNPFRWPAEALEVSAASRARISQVWDAVRPELLAHGHMHVAAGGRTEDGRRVASFGKEGQTGNIAILDMNTLTMAVPHLSIIRRYAEQWEDERLERERRAASVARSMDSMAVDGLAPTPDALRDAEDYIDGRRTLDEIVEDVVRRHTRRPEDEP